LVLLSKRKKKLLLKTREKGKRTGEESEPKLYLSRGGGTQGFSSVGCVKKVLRPCSREKGGRKKSKKGVAYAHRKDIKKKKVEE